MPRKRRRRNRASTSGNPGKPEVREVGKVKKSIDWSSIVGADTRNPDLAVKKWGLKYFMDEVEPDPQYGNCIDTRKGAVLRRPWQIVPADKKSTSAVEQAEFVKWNLESMEGTWRKDMEDMLDDKSMGVSYSEKIWYLIEDGPWRGKWGLKALRAKPPYLYDYITDEFGNVKEDGLVYKLPGDSTRHPLPRNKFVVCTSRSKYENPYGSGLAAACVWFVWMKKNLAKFRLVYSERFGSPTPMAKIPRDIGDEELAYIQAILETLQQTSAFWYPEGVEIKLLEALRGSQTDYQAFLDWCDEQIAKRVLGQPGTTESGKKSSYAAKKSDLVVQDDVTDGDADELQDQINEQIVAELIDYNFPVPEYPEFVFIKEKRTAELGPMTLKVLLDYGQKIGQNWASENYGISIPEEGEELLTPPAGGSGPMGFRSMQWPVERFTESPEDLLRFTQKVTEELEGTAAAGIEASNEIIRAAVTRWLEQVKSSGAFESKDPSKALELGLDFGELESLVYNLFYWGNLKGITDGQFRLVAHGWRPTKGSNSLRLLDAARYLRFAEIPPSYIPRPEEAFQYFKRLQIVPRDVFDAQALRGKATTIAYLESQAALRLGHKHLLEAINQGWSYGQFRDALLADTTFADAYLPAAGARANAHIETVLRTNLNGAYNQGRLEMFNDPDIGDFVEGYEYNALMDGRQRPSHGAMNGKRYRKSNPIWQVWIPPNGYNCRCYIEPITQMDGPWRESKRPPETVSEGRGPDKKDYPVIPDEGFGQPTESRRPQLATGAAVGGG